jgi:hypothetical protein
MGANAFPGANVERKLVDSTIAEVRRDRPVDAARVLARLQDWKIRVDRLYDFFESALGSPFTYDRTDKHRIAEDQVQRAGLVEERVPVVDVLRIEHPSGSPRAKLVPRALWVIGANGRIEFRVLGSDKKVRQYYLVDRSLPLSGSEKAAWYLIDPSNVLDPHPVTERLLREVMGHRADARG